MIKTVLKHYLYEISIDVLFNKLIHNFTTIKESSIPIVGERYKIVSHIYGDEHYHNCVAIHVELRGNEVDHYYVVQLTYEHSSGDDSDIYFDDVEEMFDNDDEIYLIDESQTFGDIIEDEGLEFIEGDGYIVLNSKYYTFHT